MARALMQLVLLLLVVLLEATTALDVCTVCDCVDSTTILCRVPVSMTDVVQNAPLATEKLYFACASEQAAVSTNINRLVNLKRFKVCGTLTALPEELFTLTNLKTLELNKNNLVTLPQNICNLPLKNFRAKKNKFTEFPSALLQCSTLVDINLSGNQITSVPDLPNLTKLYRLKLRNNMVTTLAESLRTLTKLKRLVLEGNPLQCCSLDWLVGWTAIDTDAECATPPEMAGEMLATTTAFPDCAGQGPQTHRILWHQLPIHNSPPVIQARVGDTIEWYWTLQFEIHTVRPLDHFDIGPNSPGNFIIGPATYSWVVPEAGLYNFYCDIHPDMTGRILAEVDDIGVPTPALPSSPLLEKWVDELPTPTDYYPDSNNRMTIEMEEVQVTLHRDLPPTTMWTYEGLFPGPTLHAQKDQALTVTWRNNLRDLATDQLRTHHLLPVDTCLNGPHVWRDLPRTVPHLHGAHAPSKFDGHPDYAFVPGEEREYIYPNQQEASTLWYHDHGMGITRLSVYLGLAGMYIVHDQAAEDAMGLPPQARQLPLVFTDRRFLANGTLYYPPSYVSRLEGDVMLVNGKVFPKLTVTRKFYFFRLLNACNSRHLNLTLSDSTLKFIVVGSELGFLGAPVQADFLMLGPGERSMVIVDFSTLAAGQEVYITNGFQLADTGTSDIPLLLKIVVQDSGQRAYLPPANPQPLPPPNPNAATLIRSFTMQHEPDECTGARWTINNKGFNDITEIMVKNSVEIWDFVNPSTHVHPMHIHMIRMRILSRISLDDPSETEVLPLAYESGWEDTVLVMPRQTARVLVYFQDMPGRYVYHCHVLEHEDQEMMRQFRVIHHPTDCNHNSICEANEDCFSCPNDCSRAARSACGNGLCETAHGETCQSCAQDCAGDGINYCCGADATCSDPRCVAEGWYCLPEALEPACCGDDVCEGSETAAQCPIDCA
eukprot:m.144139 g.144139  ORF g.144139 m.144139 type:complete len:941 (-) comp20452_c0_seq1:112-2934(-)